MSDRPDLEEEKKKDVRVKKRIADHDLLSLFLEKKKMHG